jgi:multidrug efflux pump subunit AcrA (membrane-fusion protein)
MKRIPKKFLIGAGIVVIVILIVVGNLSRGKEKTLSVQMGTVDKGSITATVRAPGTVRPEKEVQVSSSVPGRVVQLLVREGERVQQGRLLLQLDKTRFSRHGRCWRAPRQV